MTATEQSTRSAILEAAKHVLLGSGYAGLSTRKIAEIAGVPLCQIHYHFGSKQGLVLSLLADENERLLKRQRSMYAEDLPLWKQWEQACDFLEDDLASGYVRVLQEMTAAGWSDPEIAAAVRQMIESWFKVMSEVAARAAERVGGLGPFTPDEAGVIAGAPFLGIESLILLGFEEKVLPMRSALRKFGELLRSLEEGR
ncbi:MAG: TetR/AcrR family transcriptional regulator [Acidimicrobiales bacterium]|nr:TetR/AcrR family transcriptional regulator [Acidimicrobiales bacterium]